MKVVRFALLMAMLLTLVTVGLTSAQGGITYSSGFTVQNLSGNAATILLDFYKKDGTVANSKTYTVNPNSSKTFYPINDVTPGFDGSLVISSDQDIRAINNLVGSGPASYFDATTGFQAGSTTVNLPLIMCGNNGFNTWFNVQNTGSAPANITINYVPGSAGVAASETKTIPAGAAATFDQAAGSSTKNCSTMGPKFVGSAKITSDQPIVAAVMQVNSTTSFKVLMGYGGFTAGSPNVVLPLIMANNSAFYTSMQIQNIGTADTTVTVKYSTFNRNGTPVTPQDETFTLAAGKSTTILQSGTAAQANSKNDWNAFGKYVGGAAISNSANQPLVAIVNQVRANPAIGSAYSGFDPTLATAKISAPLVMANNSTYYTSIQVQNPSSSATVAVSVAYGPNTDGTFNPAAESFQLAPGQMKTILQSGTPSQNGGVNDWTGTGKKYVGSATITSTGGNIVAIINQVSLSFAGDQMASYNAFNY